ncbi:hypothetical protein ECZU36_24220 [Escherichia coli]|nr:hypothetical protein ECZU36_24220 [Escherichia coli]
MRSFNVLCHIKSMPQGAQGRPIAAAPAPLANKIAAARFPQLIPCGYRVGRKGTSL